METGKIVVTGDRLFLRRFAPLVEALSPYCEQLECVAGDTNIDRLVHKLIYKFNPIWAERLLKNHQTFISKSKRLARKLSRLPYRPDFILHFLGLYSPFCDQFPIPYGMYLDYTMMLVHRNWLPWAPFKSHQELNAWINYERLSYEQAHHLFTMSHLVKDSLVEDYDIQPEKISVVGYFPNRQALYEGERTFGTKQILCTGADFERKGSDLVLAAFDQVKAIIPEARLVIIGIKLASASDGVESLGQVVSQAEMRQIYLNSDLVVAPSRCDPFPALVLEAMNFGTPCIVSNVDGLPEMVDHDVNGIVVNQPTPDLLAEQITSLLSDVTTLTKMSQRAREKVKTQFTCEIVAQKILQPLSI